MPGDQLHTFSNLPKDFGDAAELAQNKFAESIASLDVRIADLKKEERTRKVVAIVLKVVSVLSSLIIAMGFVKGSVAQILGGTITAMAALERVFANLNRLLAVAAARSAYDRIRRKVVAFHDDKIVEVVKIRDRRSEDAANMLIEFLTALGRMIAKAKDDIENGLERNEYEALGRLSLDEPHQTAHPDHTNHSAPAPDLPENPQK